MPFFAHWPTPGLTCAWADQGIEHERLKVAACRAAVAAGFEVQTEVSAPDGSWQADCVIADATGKPVMAIRIQLTRATGDEVRERDLALRRDMPMTCWFLGPLCRSIFVQERPDRAVSKLRGDIEAAGRMVAERLGHLLGGHDIWHPSNETVVRAVPFRLAGHRQHCDNCGLEFAHLPIARLMLNEAQPLRSPQSLWSADLPVPAVQQALKAYSDRTGVPTAERVTAARHDQAYACPCCAAPVATSRMEPQMAGLWPGRIADGAINMLVEPRDDREPNAPGFWGPPTPAPEPWIEPPPDPEAWRTLLKDHRRQREAVELDEKARVIAERPPVRRIFRLF